MSKNQLRFRLLIVSPAILLLLWHEDLLNTDLETILLFVLVIVSFLMVVFDVRARKTTHDHILDKELDKS
jgi:Flp pilus assembly protein TadB